MAISKLSPQAPGLPAFHRLRSTPRSWMHARLTIPKLWLAVAILCGALLGGLTVYGSQADRRVCGQSNAHLLSRETLKSRSLNLTAHQVACFDDTGHVTIHDPGE